MMVGRLALLVLAVGLVSEAAAFAPPACRMGVGASVMRISRTRAVARSGRGPLPWLRMGSEPGWEEVGDARGAVPKAGGAAGKPVALSGAGDRVESRGAGASQGMAAELRPGLQELAQRARDKAASGIVGSPQSQSRTATWKENLARRMQEASTSNAFSLPLPGFSMESIGLKGNWREVGGSFVLDPPVPPVGVVHFIGGAFVGAAPHLAYRFFLELLSDEGFVVVATPYRLTFDYLDVCAEIEVKSKEALMESVTNNGRLPIISVGHSAGSLLHVISSCLFPGEKRAAAVLISYNNMQAKDSIPQLDQVVAPASEFLVREGDPVKKVVLDLRARAEDLTTELAASGFAPRSFGTEFLTLAADGFEVVEQVPGLLTDIAEGRKEFFPECDEIKELVKTSYKMPSTLVVGFENDGFDESGTLKGLLSEAGVDYESSLLQGNHGTPLIPDPLISTPLDAFDPLLPLRRQIRQRIIEKLWGLTKVVTPYLMKKVK